MAHSIDPSQPAVPLPRTPATGERRRLEEVATPAELSDAARQYFRQVRLDLQDIRSLPEGRES